jgi:hypothetical protein
MKRKLKYPISELLKPLGEKKWQGNVYGARFDGQIIMNVEKEVGPAPSPSVTPSVTPTPSITPTESITPTPSVTPTESITPTPSSSFIPSVTPTPTPTPSSTLPALLAFQQTDSNFTNGDSGACSGWQAADAYFQKTATVGGSAGTSTYTIQTSNNSTQWGLQHKLTIPSGTTWNAGTWTVKLQVGSTGNNNVTLSHVYICRVNSSNVSQATIGSATPGTTVSANSLITVNITGSAQTPSSGDYVNIVYVFANTVGTPSTLSFTVKSDQIINSPFT